MSSSPLPGKRVVVYVEDDPSSIAFMRDLLADFDAVQLVPAFSPTLARELVDAWHPAVVIVNLSLSGTRGAAGVQQLLASPELRGVPVIGLSAHSLSRDAARLLKAGVRHHLTQPIDVGELMDVLEHCLGSARAAPGSAPERPACPQPGAPGVKPEASGVAAR